MKAPAGRTSSLISYKPIEPVALKAPTFGGVYQF